MSRKIPISPSDYFYMLLINGLVRMGRTGNLSEPSISQSLICFLADSIDGIDFIKYESPSEIKNDMAAYLPELLVFVDGLLMQNEIVNVDNLVDFVESLRLLFAEDTASSPNAVTAPTKLCKSSMLGGIVRYFLVRWDTMSFESLCYYFEILVDFFGEIESISTIAVHSPQKTFKTAEDILLEKASIAISLGNIDQAEDSIHMLFDTLTFQAQSRAISGSFAIGTNLYTSVSVESSTDALSLARSPQLAANNRPQQATLSLASLWASNKCYGLASSAVEEAMKMAHQRGDHASVAKALLLLHYVVLGQDSDTQSSYFQQLLSADDILCKCLERCVEAKQVTVAAQAGIRLATLRGMGDLQGVFNSNITMTFSPMATMMDTSSHVGNQLFFVSEVTSCCTASIVSSIPTSFSGVGRSPQPAVSGMSVGSASVHAGHVARSISSVWAVWLASQFGDSKITSQIAAGVFKNAFSVTSLNPSPTPQSKVADTPQFPSAVESVSRLLAVAVAAINLWNRMGLSAMVELQCRRALRHVLCVAELASEDSVARNHVSGRLQLLPIDDVVLISCLLVKATIETSVPLCVVSANRSKASVPEASVAVVEGLLKAERESGIDIGTACGIDIGTDGGIDIGTDGGIDIGTDGGIDIGTDGGAGVAKAAVRTDHEHHHRVMQRQLRVISEAQRILKIAAKISEGTQSRQSPTSQALLDSTKAYILARKALLQGDHAKAIRLTARLVELTGSSFTTVRRPQATSIEAQHGTSLSAEATAGRAVGAKLTHDRVPSDPLCTPHQVSSLGYGHPATVGAAVIDSPFECSIDGPLLHTSMDSSSSTITSGSRRRAEGYTLSEVSCLPSSRESVPPVTTTAAAAQLLHAIALSRVDPAEAVHLLSQLSDIKNPAPDVITEVLQARVAHAAITLSSELRNGRLLPPFNRARGGQEVSWTQWLGDITAQDALQKMHAAVEHARAGSYPRVEVVAYNALSALLDL